MVVFLLFLVAILFFAPVVPFAVTTGSSPQLAFLGGYEEATADVSPSNAVFHCGEVTKVQVSSSNLGVFRVILSWKFGWVC